MAKQIKVTLEIEVPDDATDQDIKDWVDVELCSWNSMKASNPCIDGAEVFDCRWEHWD